MKYIEILYSLGVYHEFRVISTEVTIIWQTVVEAKGIKYFHQPRKQNSGIK